MYNEYEASEVMEVGKAEALILGEKEDIGLDEPGVEPFNKRTIQFANYDE